MTSHRIPTPRFVDGALLDYPPGVVDRGGPADLGRHVGWRVVYTRGAGVRRTAELLSEGPPRPIRSDLPTALIEARADMLVARHLTTSNLVQQATPYQVEPSQVQSIVGAVGTGSHSGLVARASARLAMVLEVPARLIAASPDPSYDPAAEAALEQSAIEAPGVDRVLLRMTNITDLAHTLPPNTLLVLGAPGGSWLQRQFFGPGRQLTVRAPAGALVVRDAPQRCYQRLEDSDVYGPEMRVGDALRLLTTPAAPVAKDGQIVGLIRRSTLMGAPSEAMVSDVMDPPVSVRWDAPFTAAQKASADLTGAPVPVVGPHGQLIGEVRA